MTLPRNTLSTNFVGKEQVFYAEDCMIFDKHRGKPIIIPANALSDGLSIPKIFQSFFSKSPYYIYAGLLHDILYKKGCYDHISRRQADLLFKFYMKEYGVSFLQRSMIYSGVRIGGWKHYKKEPLRFSLEGLTV